MSGENNSIEYIKVVADILEVEMNLAPAIPTSTNPADRRVFIYNQNFDLPNYQKMFVVLKENPGKAMAVKSSFDPVTNNEVQELIIQKEITIDVLSRNAEARQRKEEVLMALASVYSQQQQELNGFRVFSYPTSFVDVSEAEGAGNIYRYRSSVFLHVRYKKQKGVEYYDTFDYNTSMN